MRKLDPRVKTRGRSPYPHRMHDETGEHSEFDSATAVRPGPQPGEHLVDIDPGWMVGPKPNGGYLLAVAARAAGATMDADGVHHVDPLAATTHYLRAPDPGPATVRTEVLRTGRSASQVRSTIYQGDQPAVDVVFTLGTLSDDEDQAWWVDDSPAVVPPLDECKWIPPNPPGSDFVVSMRDRVDLWLDPAGLGFAVGEPTGRADFRGWTRFRDGREPDPLSLLYFVDSLPPATFDLVMTGWVPTLSLTAYVRARPAPGPLQIRQYARSVDGGRVDEVCDVWDSTGRLVAQATQLAAIRIPEGTTPAPRR